MGAWRYLMGVLEIFDGCPVDIRWVSWRYFMDVLDIWCRPGDIWSVLLSYLMGSF